MIIRSDCRGEPRNTSAPKRAISKREALIDIISMAQQASPKVMGQMEFLRAQFTALSSVVSTMPSEAAAAALSATDSRRCARTAPEGRWQRACPCLYFRTDRAAPVESKLTSRMPPETFEQLLEPRRRGARHRSGLLGHLGPLPRNRRRPPSRPFCAPWALPPDTREELERSLAARDPARMGAPAAARHRDRGIRLRRSSPLQRAGGTPGRDARISSVRREDGDSAEFDLNLRDLPHAGSAEMDGRTWVRKLARLRGAPAAGLSRDHRAAGRHAQRRHALHRHARSAPGPIPHLGRGGRAGGYRHQPLRRALGAQLGLRRFPRPAGRSWIGRPTIWTPASSASTRCTPSTTAARSTPAPTCRTASSTRTSSTWISKAWRISRAAGGRARCGDSPAVAAEIAALRALRFVEYERVAALKLRFLKLLFVEFLREWRRGSARAREFQAFAAREGDLLERFATYCALDEHLHRRNPDVWVWTEWPAPYQDPAFARDARFPQAALARGDVAPVPAVADRRAVAARAAEGPRPAAAPSACTTTWRWPRTASAPTCGPTGPFFVAGAAWVRRPTISRPRARTGASRRPTPSATARTATACSPNPSARTAATAARCASITSCACSACTGFPMAATPPHGAYVRRALARIWCAILALESVRNRW